MYLAPQNSPRAISVLTLGNKVILYCILLATAVTRMWNGRRNESQHRKLTMEKKNLPPLIPGLEPEKFLSRVRRSTTAYYNEFDWFDHAVSLENSKP